MIAYFRLTEMRFTPFGKGGNPFEDLGRGVLQKEGIVPTESPWKCNAFVANRILPWRDVLVKSKLFALTKPMLVWSHEPRYGKVFNRILERRKPLPPLHIMSMYTGDLFLTNYSFYSWAIIPPKLGITAVEASESARQRRIAAVMTYIKDPATSRTLIKDSQNLDLCALRQEIALSGYVRNLVDIFGRGWPDGMAKGCSRGEGWHELKNDLLRSYRFNLCMENTTYDYYCSEKIWDAIHASCLPIYYGKNNRIYNDFPRHSFVDAAEYPSPAELLDHVEAMTTA